jgi:hypothetical protein
MYQNVTNHFPVQQNGKISRFKRHIKEHPKTALLHGSLALGKGILSYATHKQSDELIQEIEKWSIEQGFNLTGKALKHQKFDSNSHRLAQLQISNNTVNIMRLLEIIKKQAINISDMKTTINQHYNSTIFENINNNLYYLDNNVIREHDFNSYLHKKNVTDPELIELFKINPITACLYIEKYEILRTLLNGEKTQLEQRFESIPKNQKKQLEHALKKFGRDSDRYTMLRNQIFRRLNTRPLPEQRENPNQINITPHEQRENPNQINITPIDEGIEGPNDHGSEGLTGDGNEDHNGNNIGPRMSIPGGMDAIGGKKKSSKKQPKSSVKKSTKSSTKKKPTKSSTKKKPTKSSTKKTPTKSSTKKTPTKSSTKKTPTKSSTKKKPTKSSTKKQVKK